MTEEQFEIITTLLLFLCVIGVAHIGIVFNPNKLADVAMAVVCAIGAAALAIWL